MLEPIADHTDQTKPNRRLAIRIGMALILMASSSWSFADDGLDDSQRQLKNSIRRSIELLETASRGSAEKRVCFTCHGQALPVFALVAARDRGFDIDSENLQRQLEHTYAHLKRGRKAYAKGKGQGGGVDTAGYALWTLEDGGQPTDQVTDAVTEYLLQKQRDDGKWNCSSDRPPSESSDFTTTYLALRALSVFSTDSRSERSAKAVSDAGAWLKNSIPSDTEDLVFGLLSTDYVELPADYRDNLMERISNSQRPDGGWAQKPEMDSDAYATATVLYALNRSGMDASNPTCKRGIAYLLKTQLDDGSWYVKSRSKPFQKYFETGFPHGADQFISTSATAWATLALLSAFPPLAEAGD